MFNVDMLILGGGLSLFVTWVLMALVFSYGEIDAVSKRKKIGNVKKYSLKFFVWLVGLSVVFYFVVLPVLFYLMA